MDEIASWIWDRLDADDSLDDESKFLILKALEGEPLGERGAPPQWPTTDGGGEQVPEPAGAFISSIIVQGFRGIGDAARLDLSPRPGLTIVSGRNGSGKSSFSEALEIALTGSTYRWHNKRNKQYEEVWRNVHVDVAPRVEVVLAEENVGKTRIFAQWSGDAVDSVELAMQRQGEKRVAGTEALGWEAALTTYRPLLSYDELDGILATEPSKLYDAISTVLGLEQIADAIKALAEYSSNLAAGGSQLTKLKGQLLFELAQSEDERAAEAEKLLRAKALDPAALRALATGAGTTDSSVSVLRSLGALSLPEVDVSSAAESLRRAVAAMAAAGDQAALILEEVTHLKRKALELHAHQGDMLCPVCSVGRLDQDWAAATSEDVAANTNALERITEARAQLSTARQYAQSLILPVPPQLKGDVPSVVRQEAQAARSVWESWSSAHPQGDLELADHLEKNHPPVLDAVAALSSAANHAAVEREDTWAPLASQLASYADLAEAWLLDKPASDRAKKAAKWLRDNDLQLKNQRLEPIAEAAGEIWEDLRQESNVGLAGLTLEGTNTRRRLSIEADVDGHEAGALAVMSQGELHALALTLFLPRATLPASPFRFVVLDDPVQAMDPAKVDGLVAVLGRIAEKRQVIVFTHDDRLASAVRRSPIDAQILEVQRGAGSRVNVVNTFDPPMRYLRDAHALIKDDGLPDDTRRRVLPGMLRFALEAALRDRYFSQRLAAGISRAEVEVTWEAAMTTSQRLALAVPGGDATSWLKRDYRRRGMGICTSAAHSLLKGDVEDAYVCVRRMVEDIRSGAK